MFHSTWINHNPTKITGFNYRHRKIPTFHVKNAFNQNQSTFRNWVPLLIHHWISIFFYLIQQISKIRNTETYYPCFGINFQKMLLMWSEQEQILPIIRFCISGMHGFEDIDVNKRCNYHFTNLLWFWRVLTISQHICNLTDLLSHITAYEISMMSKISRTTMYTQISNGWWCFNTTLIQKEAQAHLWYRITSLFIPSAMKKSLPPVPCNQL